MQGNHKPVDRLEEWIKVSSQEMKEQLDLANMTRQIEGTHLELYKTGENDTTQEKDNIFVWNGGRWECLVTAQR